jgi:hypothetical protein
LIQLAINGATRVEPAPLISAEAAAVEIDTMQPITPTTATDIPSNLLRSKGESFLLVTVLSLPQALDALWRWQHLSGDFR